MNPYPDVDTRAGVAAADPAATAQPGTTPAPTPAPGGDRAPRARAHDSGAERLSVDPLRATDRYRLAAPIELRL